MKMSIRQSFTMALLGLAGMFGGKAAAQRQNNPSLPIDVVTTHMKNYAGATQFTDTGNKRLYFVGKKEPGIMSKYGTNRYELGLTLKDSKFGTKKDTIDLLDDVQQLTYVADPKSGERIVVDLVKGKGSIMAASNFSKPNAPPRVSDAQFDVNFEAGIPFFAAKYGSIDKAVQEAQELYGLPDLLTTSHIGKLSSDMFHDLMAVTRAEMGKDGKFMHVSVNGQYEDEELHTVVFDKNGNNIFGDAGDGLGYTLYTLPGSPGETVAINFTDNRAGILKIKKGTMPDIDKAYSDEAAAKFKNTFKDIGQAAEQIELVYGVTPQPQKP